MKNIPKVTKVKLKINQINDFILLGLVANEPDYKLSLALNKKFRIFLKNISPLILPDDKGHELAFSRFSYTNDSPEIIYTLISNRSGKHSIIKKLRNIDYIFQVQDSDNETNISRITSNLREIDTIIAVFKIDINSIKDKNIQYLIH